MKFKKVFGMIWTEPKKTDIIFKMDGNTHYKYKIYYNFMYTQKYKPQKNNK